MIFINFTELYNRPQNLVLGHVFNIPKRSIMRSTNLDDEFRIRVIAVFIQCLLWSELCCKQCTGTDSFNLYGDPRDRHCCFPFYRGKNGDICHLQEEAEPAFEFQRTGSKAVDLSHHAILLFNIYRSFEKQDKNSNNYLCSFSVSLYIINME